MNRRRRSALSALLPVFPWDTLADATALARSHPDGIVDLSVGTPVDPVAPLIREALAAASAAPGYPTTAGTPALRQSAVAALERRYGVTGVTEAAVLPVIGTKELIAWLPTLLGLGAEDLVVVPELAYPTYDVGARLAGTRVLYADSLTQLGPAVARIGVREFAEQSDRAGARRRSSAQGRRLGPGARRAGRIRRVLPGPGLGTPSRCRYCIRRCATATTPVCWRCTRCPRAPRWPATGPASSPATRPWSPSCWRCANTPG